MLKRASNLSSDESLVEKLSGNTNLWLLVKIFEAKVSEYEENSEILALLFMCSVSLCLPQLCYFLLSLCSAALAQAGSGSQL